MRNASTHYGELEIVDVLSVCNKTISIVIGVCFAFCNHYEIQCGGSWSSIM